MDAPPIAPHEAEGHHRQGQRRGIDDVEQGIGRQLAALHQMVHPQGKHHRKWDQHQGGVQAKEDAEGDAQQGGMAQGITKEGQLAKNGEAAQNPSQGSCE